MNENYSAEEREAYQLGKNAAEAAASWVITGNSNRQDACRVLRMLGEGDPEAYDYLPRRPDLSGEWAGEPTPQSLALELFGNCRWGSEGEYADAVESLGNAWESGVNDHFESACEAELIVYLRP